MEMLVQQKPKVMHKHHRTKARGGGCAGALSPKSRLESTHEDAQHRPHRFPLAPKQVAYPFGDREHPLAMSDFREHVVGEVGGRLHYAPCVSRGTDSARLTGKRHKKIIAASVTPRPGASCRYER